MQGMSVFMTVIMSTFGKRVRQLRLKKKLSQERLAELAGLHITFVGAIERGKRNLSLVTIVKLAKALKVKPGELFRGIRT
jgi:transcriptional regulator with XRE-family HTH domain